MAPKHTKPKVARTRKMRYFSRGRKDAAFLGPIKAVRRPLDAGGIFMQQHYLSPAYSLFAKVEISPLMREEIHMKT